ncbi:MAG: prepilin-type N-terminal cleavage/methylation domain-containing protein [Chitinispirillaceae bacterium]|nr:prepilin-type N-terminal cleavage/methylation domain-containing protein [Chitinispirillaceae bacterium]
MKKRGGFTLLEVAMVMAILGIMAAFTIIKYNKTVANSELENAANNLHSELRGLRSLGFKYDARVRARFNPEAAQCTIWVDTSDDESLELKLIRIYQIRPPVKIGRSPSEGTYPSPYPGDPNYPDWRTPCEDDCEYSNGTEGSWRHDKYLDVFHTTEGQYGGGGVYLYHPRLNTTTYFIGIAWQRSQSIDIKKWNGTSWDDR